MTGFVPAERGQVYLKVALFGPPGSGKSMGSLLLASGMTGQGRIAVADSEGGRSSLYAGTQAEGGIAQFDALRIKRPFFPQKYIEAIELAIDGSYDCLVIDSLSHAWAYEGGVLDEKQRLDEEHGEAFGNWRQAKRPHSELVVALINSPIHIIATMRSRIDYQFDKDGQGKTSVRKVGLAPMQQNDMPYEFDITLDIGDDHSVFVSKDRTRTLQQRLSRLTLDHGALLKGWLECGSHTNPIDSIPAVGTSPTQQGSIQLGFTVRQTADRTYGEQTYTLLVGDEFVVRVPRMTQQHKTQLTDALGQVETRAVPSGQTIRVGTANLPVYIAAGWKAAQLEVNRNGR